MKKLFNNVLSRLSPETLQHIKLVGIVMGVTIVILGGIMLLFGKRDKIAQAFKPGELPPTPTVTPTIIFDKDVLGAQEDNSSAPSPTPTKSTIVITPTKVAQTPTPTPQSSNPTSTPLPTSAQATPTTTPAPTSSQPAPEQNSLYLSPSNPPAITNGSNLTVELRMNTSENVNINAVSAKISYPTDKLDFQTIEAADTFGIQPTEGKASGGVVSIDRGSLSPVTGDKPIVKITFKTKATGSVELKFDDGKLLKSSDNKDTFPHKTGGTYTIQ